jgi:hypothetical protein
MKKYILAISVLGIFFITSCGNDAKKASELEVVEVNTAEKVTYSAATTEATFNDPKIATVYEEYIQLKTALVNTDAVATAAEASSLMIAFTNIDTEEEVLKAAQTIAEATDVEVQRKAFVVVTDAVEKMLDGAITSGVIYKQFCPMAFDFEGAYWLSNSKQISNPYFGDKMLRCGKVDSEIK